MTKNNNSLEGENKPFRLYIPLVLGLAVALGMFLGFKLPRYDSNTRFFPNRLVGGAGGGSAFDEVLQFINAKYVDTVGTETIEQEAIEKLLDQLDPHSVYISPEEMQQVEEDMQGNFEGVGIEFLIVDDTIVVVTPLVGGPSEAAGIVAGDRLISVNDSIVAGIGIDNNAIFKLLRGPKGSPVALGVLRQNETQKRVFDIKRDVIPIHSVETAYLLDEKTAYVKINRFSGTTFQEFIQSLQPLKEKTQIKNLMLDLRGNPGGFMDEAVNLLSQLFPKDKLLVYTQGRNNQRQEYTSTGRSHGEFDQVAVLIDEGSASASEIVAGAIQDYDRGWVVGRRSFGKGLVQEQYPLRNGGAIRLTVARYYTPSGRSIQREYKNNENYDDEQHIRLEKGELVNGDSVTLADTVKYYTGAGRIVYGGGGITPDFFIPLDTTILNKDLNDIRQGLPAFVSKIMPQLEAMALPKDAVAFANNWMLPEALFTRYLAEQKAAQVNKLNAEAKKLLKLLLKARIGKVLFQSEGFYRVLNSDDPAVEKAHSLLKKGDYPK